MEIEIDKLDEMVHVLIDAHKALIKHACNEADYERCADIRKKVNFLTMNLSGINFYKE